RLADREISGARIVGMDAALHADFRPAARPGFFGPPDHFLDGEVVRSATQSLARLPLGEGAEAAMEIADVRIVDVPVDDIADGLAAHAPAQLVRRLHHIGEVAAACAEEPDDFRLVEPPALPGLLDQPLRLAVCALAGARPPPVGDGGLRQE